MLDRAITEYLEDKKRVFLDKKVKTNTSEEDRLKFIQEANEKYGLENWLIDASSRAKQLSLTSHPAKFIHPNAKASSIISSAIRSSDGLLRSGNIEVELDVFGNAAALDVERFLRLKLQNGKNILQNLEDDTDLIKQQFHTKNTGYLSIRKGFMMIKRSDMEQTSEKLKQVYFPVDDDYHLLSVLIPSGLIYKLKERINELRFSNENKRLREEQKKTSPEPTKGQINEIFDLTLIGYGGTKPQNISTLNSQNRGICFLLSSIPPLLSKRKTQAPKKSFFDSCLWSGFFKDDFTAFHEVLVDRRNNIDIRDKRDDIVISSISKVKWLLEQIRGIGSNWSDSDTYDDLESWEKIWLDEKYQSIRGDDKQNNDYINKAQSHFANWFIGSYKHTVKDSKLLGNDDIDHIKEILKQEQELLA